MQLVDPLFQREVVLLAQAYRIPVVLDEVFVGCYRLGPPSTAGILGVRQQRVRLSMVHRQGSTDIVGMPPPPPPLPGARPPW